MADRERLADEVWAIVVNAMEEAERAMPEGLDVTEASRKYADEIAGAVLALLREQEREPDGWVNEKGAERALSLAAPIRISRDHIGPYQVPVYFGEADRV